VRTLSHQAEVNAPGGDAYDENAFAISSFELHVWIVRMPTDLATISLCLETLSPQERARAAKMVHAPTRTSHVVMRSAARLLLSRYLRCHPITSAFPPAATASRRSKARSGSILDTPA
jgi:hypothetical protein